MLPKLFVVLVVLGGYGEFHFHREHAAFAELALHRQHAAHKTHHVFGYSHAESGALYALCVHVYLTRERVENFFHELFAHADAVVFNGYAQVRVIVRRFLESFHGEFYVPSLGRVFHRVGQKVQKYLIESHSVAEYALGQMPFGVHVEGVFFGVGLRHYYGIQFFQKFGEGEFLYVERGFAALYLAHIEYIVYKA